MAAQSPDVFLGRQPIYDRMLRLVGYELLFRDAGNLNGASFADDVAATAAVVAGAFYSIGIQTVVGERKAFINVNTESLLSPMIETLPSDHVVLELLESVEVTEQVIVRCRALKAQGYRLALDDFCCYGTAYEPLLEIVDIVKVDVQHLDAESLSRLVSQLKLFPPQLLAEKIDTHAIAQRCLGLGFDLFQGFWFGQPVLLTAPR